MPGASWISKTLEAKFYALILFLARNYSKGGKAVLIIDEAQNLPYPTIKLILRLSGIRKGEYFLIQTVLIGQSRLMDNLLAAISLKDIKKHISIHCELKPLDREDIRPYVEHRLRIVGSAMKARFNDKVYEAIYAGSQGIPRRTQMCRI